MKTVNVDAVENVTDTIWSLAKKQRADAVLKEVGAVLRQRAFQPDTPVFVAIRDLRQLPLIPIALALTQSASCRVHCASVSAAFGAADVSRHRVRVWQ